MIVEQEISNLSQQLANYRSIRSSTKDAWLIQAVTALIEDAEDLLTTLRHQKIR
jgi:hypothetical protein